MADQEVNLTIKFVLAGPDGVGKSRLVTRLARDEWAEHAPYESTLGIDFAIRTVYLKESKSYVRCRFWDTSGQSRFHAVTMSYYQHADVLLLCFDASQPASLDACLKDYRVQKWIDTANQGVYVALVGCKFDAKVRDDEEMMRKLEGTGLPVFWTSARDGTSVAELVQTAGEHVMRIRRKEVQEERFMDSAYLVPKPIQERRTCECLLM
jgi:small GTP-binding protein